MQYAVALLALAGSALARPQGVTSAISPSGDAPSGCMSSVSGSFSITIQNVSSSAKRSLEERQTSGTLTLKLSDGTLTDQAGRTGYIAANNQFQFDKPPQTGAIYTAGWSMCSNGSLAIGDQAVFYQCLSGTFYNLYSKPSGKQCNEVYMISLGGSGQTTVAAGEGTDGQPTATTAVSEKTDGQPAVTQISDGQIQATTGAPVTELTDGQPQGPKPGAVTQISDGQPQASTGAAVTQISDGQPQASTGAAPVSQISDGQPQASTGAAVTQISDGQVQASTAVSQLSDGQPQAPTGGAVSEQTDGQPIATSAAVSEKTDGQPVATSAQVSEKTDGQPIATAVASGSPVTQISDGQIQATTGAPVTQISDGQPQATTGAPVTQISDGQVQATTGAPVTQISDGQPQAGNATVASSPSASLFTGAAAPVKLGQEVLGAAIGLMGAVALL